jgi:hypothetical protein
MTNDSGRPHIAEVGPARPGPSVRVTKFDSDEIALICQRHINARLDIAEFRYGALRQREMRRRTTSAAEVDFCGGIVLVFPAIFFGRAVDADFGGVEIGPASARLAAESAIALVDEVRSFCHFDADLAAETGKLQHSRLISGDAPA